MLLDDYYEIGYILKPHGLKGAVSILLDVDDPAQYSEMESVVVNMDGSLIPFFISSIQINGRKGILSLEEINDIEQAAELKSCSLLLPIEVLPQLDEDQFYYHDVIGFTIVDDHKGKLGEIENIYTEGNQDLISMKYKNREVLIPVSKEIVGKADHEKEEVYVTLPEGLLDIYM